MIQREFGRRPAPFVEVMGHCGFYRYAPARI